MMSEPHKKTAFIVDPYSSGNFYAPAFREHGVPAVGVLSFPPPPDVFTNTLRPGDFDWVIDSKIVSNQDLADLVRSHNPLCILPGCESGVELAEAISEAALPERSNIPGSAAARRHKGQMAEALRRADIPVIAQICSNSQEEVEKWIVENSMKNKDLMIKPPKSAATDGVSMIPGGSNWKDSFNRLLGKKNCLGTINEQVLVQEFIHGTEYAVDTYSYAGNHGISSVCKYNKTRNGKFTAVYDTMEWMPPEFDNSFEIIGYARRVLHAVGMRYGCCHIEIMMTNDGPRLIEIAARPHGGGHPQFCRLATGNSQIDHIISCFLSDRFVESTYQLQNNVTAVFFVCRQEGRVSNADVLDEIKELPSHHYSKINIKQGDQLTLTSDLISSLKMGVVILSNPDKSVIDKDVLSIRRIESSLF